MFCRHRGVPKIQRSVSEKQECFSRMGNVPKTQECSKDTDVFQGHMGVFQESIPGRVGCAIEAQESVSKDSGVFKRHRRVPGTHGSVPRQYPRVSGVCYRGAGESVPVAQGSAQRLEDCSRGSLPTAIRPSRVASVGAGGNRRVPLPSKSLRSPQSMRT